MTLSDLVCAHPFLALIFTLVILSAVEDIVRAARQ